MAQLQNWISQAKAHWAEFQPTKYAELKKAGKLDAALQEAAQLTAEEMNQLEESGMQPHEAWEMTREQYLFPPAEANLQEEPMASGSALHEVMGMPLGEDEDALPQA